MGSVFQPVSSLPQDALIEYLGREGNSPEIVRWKYFDARFNRNRERGYAWVKDGKIGGFLGLIPFQVALNGRVADAAWTCDWSVQDQSGRGMGILLMRQAQERYEFLAQLGGNEATQRIISRLAAKTVNDAGIMFYLPLRLGAVLRIARRRLHGLPVDTLTLFNQVPIRLLPRPAASPSLTVEPGVSEALGSVLEPDRHGELYCRYDFNYVRWQIADCPTLASETYYIQGSSAPRAAALVWRHRTAPGFWCMSLWSPEGAEKDADALLSHVIRRVYERKGFLLSLVVSHLETARIDLLRSRGFRAAPRLRPLHIIASGKTSESVPELWPLSFLDTDFAYRFCEPSYSTGNV
jgi:hypothetical protein